MRTFRTIGIVGGIAAILLSSSVALAKGQTMGQSGNGNVGNQGGLVATTTGQWLGETVRERVQAVREETKENVEALREKARLQISEIKDKVRQKNAERIANQFENFNKRWTDHFVNLLERYEAIVQKVQNRANIAASNGKDITKVGEAIQSAKSAIENAKTVIAEQAAKIYTPDISAPITDVSDDEEIVGKFRESFRNMHRILFDDLFGLRDGVMRSVRSSVQNALQVLGSISGVDDENATTTSKTSGE